MRMRIPPPRPLAILGHIFGRVAEAPDAKPDQPCLSQEPPRLQTARNTVGPSPLNCRRSLAATLPCRRRTSPLPDLLPREEWGSRRNRAYRAASGRCCSAWIVASPQRLVAQG